MSNWIKTLITMLNNEMDKEKWISARSTAQHILDLSKIHTVNPETITFLEDLIEGLDQRGFHPDHVKSVMYSSGNSMQAYCPAGSLPHQDEKHTLPTWGSKGQPCYASERFASWTGYADEIAKSFFHIESVRERVSERLALTGKLHEELYYDWVPIVTAEDSESYEKLQPMMYAKEDWKLSIPEGFRQELFTKTGTDKPEEWLRGDPHWWYATMAMHRLLRILLCKWLNSYDSLLTLQQIVIDRLLNQSSDERKEFSLDQNFSEDANHIIYTAYRQAWTIMMEKNPNLGNDEHITHCFKHIVHLPGSMVVLKKQIDLHIETLTSGNTLGFMTTCSMMEEWKKKLKDRKKIDNMEDLMSKAFKSLLPAWPFEQENLPGVQPFKLV